MLPLFLLKSILWSSTRSWHGCQQACDTGLQHWVAYLVGILNYECPTNYTCVCYRHSTARYNSVLSACDKGHRWQEAGQPGVVTVSDVRSGHDGWQCHVCSAVGRGLKLGPLCWLHTWKRCRKWRGSRQTDQTKRKQTKQNKQNITEQTKENKPIKTNKQKTNQNKQTKNKTKQTRQKKQKRTKQNREYKTTQSKLKG